MGTYRDKTKMKIMLLKNEIITYGKKTNIKSRIKAATCSISKCV